MRTLKKIFTNSLFYGAMAVAIPANFLFMHATNNWRPRLGSHNHHTLEEAIDREIYYYNENDRYFEDSRTVEKHMEKLLENIGDFDEYRMGLWRYVQYWYRPKSDPNDLGLGMYSYNDIVRGVPGSCTEGAFAFYANMRQITEVPKREMKMRHYILMITYERSDRRPAPGHVVYLGELKDKKNKRKYFIGGINPFENPTIEYNSIEEAIESNTDSFRVYNAFQMPEGVMARPQRYCVADPEYLGVDIIHYTNDDAINIKFDERNLRESKSVAIQRIFTEYFEKNAIQYHEP